MHAEPNCKACMDACLHMLTSVHASVGAHKCPCPHMQFCPAGLSLEDCLYPSAASSPGSMLSRCHRAESGQRQPREAPQTPTEAQNH